MACPFTGVGVTERPYHLENEIKPKGTPKPYQDRRINEPPSGAAMGGNA